jgi:mono/diheme cytochrome c family protein
MFRGLILAAAAAVLTLCGVSLAQAGDDLVKRGAYLVNGIAACGNCHNSRGPDMMFIPGKELAGGFTLVEPHFTVRVPNITPDKETGIGAWSDAEIITAIREGRRPDGTLIGPPMPFSQYRSISDNDVKAIVAYLRSVPAVANTVAKSEYNIPLPPA